MLQKGVILIDLDYKPNTITSLSLNHEGSLFYSLQNWICVEPTRPKPNFMVRFWTYLKANLISIFSVACFPCWNKILSKTRRFTERFKFACKFLDFQRNQRANNIFQLQERVSARDGGGWTGNQYSLPGRQNTMKKPGRQNMMENLTGNV